ncbi:hypothetical protein ACQ86G_27165 [Roseateles chitinivorans]|uniref:hypothetical protein n=1 Tax=Roseateles chitinivorans TaxID=2917965 RepID=UPI003D672D6C
MNQETQSLEALLKALRVLLMALLTLVVIAVICFRLFAYTFVGSLTVWTAMPAIVLVGLLIMLRLSQAVRRVGAMLLLVLYALSIFFFGWRHVMELYASDGPFAFDLFEAVLIVLLAVPSLVRPRATF